MVQVQARVAQLEAEVQHLRGRLNTNSSNSSLPPSANPPSAPKPTAKPPTGRKPGGQPGHTGSRRARLPADRVTHVIPHVPIHCEHCQAPLPAQPGPNDPPATWWQVAELPGVLAEVTEHQGHARTCPECGHVTRAAIPPEVLAHGLGPGLTSLLGFLSSRCHGSKRIIEEFVETVLKLPIGLGTVANAEQEIAVALQEPYAQAQAAVQAAPVKNVDETGWKQAGNRRWLWLAATATVAFFRIAASRGACIVQEMLGDAICGVVGSDRWSAYTIVDILKRQVCWAHLKRDFQKWLDWGGPTRTIGQAGQEAVRKLFEAWGRFRDGVLDRPGLQAALEPAQEDLHRALEAGLSCGNKKAARFCRNLLAVWPALWTFTREDGVEPTNNHAERTLRLAVLWRKCCFGNHSEQGCRFTERILTVVQTLRLQRREVMDYLHTALLAHRAGHPAPALVATGV